MAADIGLSDAELDALAARVEARLQDRVGDGGLSRRQLLTLLAGGTAGAAALGGGAAATGLASAGADTNDNDGDVGQPGDRVDVFADGVDSVSVNTDSLSVSPIYSGTISVPSGGSASVTLDTVGGSPPGYIVRYTIVEDIRGAEISYSITNPDGVIDLVFTESGSPGSAVDVQWAVFNLG